MVANWLIGREIVEEEQMGKELGEDMGEDVDQMVDEAIEEEKASNPEEGLEE